MFDTEKLFKDFHNSPGSLALRDNLNKCDSDKDIIRLISQFIEFNNCFAPLVANLSSRVGASCLFKKKSIRLNVVQDRSAKVAGLIFYAAIDEYSNPPHKTMSLNLLQSIIDFYKFDIVTSNRITKNSEFLEGIRMQVASAYGFNEDLTDSHQIFFNIGSHIASEGLATDEFVQMLDYIKSIKQPLFSHLSEVDESYGYAPIKWLEIHTIVEYEHFEKSVDAANLALAHRPQGISELEASVMIKKGIDAVLKIQFDFLKNIGQP
jgi:hypothetical protein